MTIDEIKRELEKTLEELDEAYQELSYWRPDKNYCDEMKKTVLNMQKAASGAKTATEREQDAYNSEEWQEYLWKAFQIDVQYVKAESQVKLLDKRFEHYRSLLSYEKNFIPRTT